MGKAAAKALSRQAAYKSRHRGDTLLPQSKDSIAAEGLKGYIRWLLRSDRLWPLGQGHH